jgi:hypothetical protein
MYATPFLSTTYTPTVRVNLAATLRPLRRGHLDPTMRVSETGIWRTLLAPTGPATLHLEARGGSVEATAWGDGAEWAIAGVPELLGEGDDWTGLDVSGNAFLADSLRRHPGLRLLRTRQVFEMLLVAILEQKVTGIEARRAWRTLLTKFGDVPPGPAPEGMRVFPSAERWKRVPSWEWHRAGVGPQRSATVMRAASVASSLERTLADGRGLDGSRDHAARARRSRFAERGRLPPAGRGGLGADRQTGGRRRHARTARTLRGTPAAGHAADRGQRFP